MRLLVVEDDLPLADVLVRGLEGEGLIADRASSARQALGAVETVVYDAIVLDVMLGDGDGFEVCRELRDRGVWAPVLMLTARTAVRDRVQGLDAGADDYLAKPFAFDELLARLRALIRRGAMERPTVLEAGDLRMDPATHQVWRGEAPVDLSMREFALLETFMRHPGQVLSRWTLLEHAWPGGIDQRSNVLEVYVRRLREKVDRPFGKASIENVRGAGYRLRADGGA